MAEVLYFAGGGWDNWRRSTDFYAEGELIWLDADVTIRKLTNNKRSLNDFAAAFEGPRISSSRAKDGARFRPRRSCRAMRQGPGKSTRPEATRSHDAGRCAGAGPAWAGTWNRLGFLWTMADGARERL